VNSSAPQRWLPAALGSSVVYLLAGMTFAALAHRAGSNQMRVTLRLAAWVISAAVFVAQVWYEHTRLRSAPRTTASHVSLAVALGALGLAVTARVPALALVAWPVATALPAFLAAFASAAALARVRPRA
jgi:uncharacterized protein (DUF486 family)